jgi:8-oxo-dGTP diphosphatase
MHQPDAHLAHAFGGRLRVRACGLCLRQNSLLLVCHRGMGPQGLWLPPGGGVAFGETLEQALRREFREETGLEVEIGPFRFAYEVLSGPFHAIEMFFDVFEAGGTLHAGSDPELPGDRQTIAAARFVPFHEIGQWPSDQKHACLAGVDGPEALGSLSGLYQYAPSFP